MSPSGGPVQYDRRPQSEVETEAPSQSGHDVFTSMGAGEEAHFGRDLECEGPQIWCPPNDGLEQHLVDLELASRTRDVSNQDILYEQLAHVFAYGQGDRTLLAEWGWVVDESLSVDNDPVSGFAMMVFRVAPAVLADPLERRRVEEIHGRRIVPVVAFRGTDICVEDLLGADTDPAGIGVTQFETWRPQIEAAIGSCGRPDVTGHSLGGALAQLAAARVGGIGRLVTFQAPGISTEDAASIDADVEATHFRVEGDLVTTAGEAMAAGTIVRFDLAGSIRSTPMSPCRSSSWPRPAGRSPASARTSTRAPSSTCTSARPRTHRRARRPRGCGGSSERSCARSRATCSSRRCFRRSQPCSSGSTSGTSRRS